MKPRVAMPGHHARVLALLPLLSLVFGLFEYGPARGPEADSTLFAIHALLSLALVFVWFRLDARERLYKASIVLNIAMLGLTIIALPYYLLRSRGFGGGFKSLALAGLVFVATMVAYRVGSWFA